MGGSEWRDKFATGELGEPGVYPPSTQPPSYISREELFEKAAQMESAAVRGYGSG